MSAVVRRALGAPVDRAEGVEKVTGAARYASDQPVERPAYALGVQGGIAKGRIASIDAAEALGLAGVLAVLTHENAPRLASLDDPDLVVLQSPEISYHGQFVAAVVAESIEVARHAAGLVRVEYAAKPHDVALSFDRAGLYKPETINAGYETDTDHGDFDSAFAEAPITLDRMYTTPCEHNEPLEPHATIARWDGDSVTLFDSNQGPHGVLDDISKAFGLDPGLVHVISPHVGGGFGCKAFMHPHVILAVMAAKVTGRAVKVALTRQSMSSVVGHRTRTFQRMRLAAAQDGRLSAIAHDVVEHTSTLEEFAEQTAVATRMMYAAPNRRTSHRLARLDVPTPSIMRAPGECPGMFALESAMDEMAEACGVDPVEFRIRNEPPVDPEDGRPFSSRGLVACLREGAQRFGWRTPRGERERTGRWLVGYGVAASTYPARRRGSSARIAVDRARADRG